MYVQMYRMLIQIRFVKHRSKRQKTNVLYCETDRDYEKRLQEFWSHCPFGVARSMLPRCDMRSLALLPEPSSSLCFSFVALSFGSLSVYDLFMLACSPFANLVTQKLQLLPSIFFDSLLYRTRDLIFHNYTHPICYIPSLPKS